MRINDLIRRKGFDVATASPEDSVTDVVRRLAELRIGALVVVEGDGPPAGIVSERDVVRRLHADGAGVLQLAVAQIMTSEVHTCTPDTSVDDLMRLMTERRIRHVPVVEDDRLTGIVSIGDVVKQRMDELQAERDQLVGYING